MGSPDIRNLIDTNVWIDALAGRLSKADFRDIAGLEILDPYSLQPTTKEDAGVPGS